MLAIILLVQLINISLAQDYFDWSNVQENDKLYCVMKPNKLFSCRGPKGIIECQSNSVNFEMKESMDIGKCENTIKEENLIVNVCIISKDSNKTSTSFNNDSLVYRNYSLYYSNSSDTDGIRIIDFNCYQKLVDFIQNSTFNANNSSEADSNDIEQAMATAEALEAVSNMYGELLSPETLIKKRFNHIQRHSHTFKRHSHQIFKRHSHQIFKRHSHQIFKRHSHKIFKRHSHKKSSKEVL